MSTEAPRVPWDEFISDVFVWEQGEHVALIGPTGQGKTNLLTQLLPLHPYVVVFATKPRDKSMVRLINSGGYYPLDRWRSLDPDKFPRRVLWPDAMSLDSENIQREVFRDAMGRIYREGGWTLAIDELWYVNNILGLTREIKTYLLQARALGISLLMATQRPAWVPLEVYDQSSHLFFWRDNDETNLKRLSGISFRSAELIRTIIADLDRYQVLYINTRTGRMCRTRSPLVTG
jgi:energy-coupling factor transporter ATP-binding protein EcfA2